jgi:hypothetical protein
MGTSSCVGRFDLVKRSIAQSHVPKINGSFIGRCAPRDKEWRPEIVRRGESEYSERIARLLLLCFGLPVKSDSMDSHK